jgi:hypothetical protein
MSKFDTLRDAVERYCKDECADVTLCDNCPIGQALAVIDDPEEPKTCRGCGGDVDPVVKCGMCAECYFGPIDVRVDPEQYFHDVGPEH